MPRTRPRSAAADNPSDCTTGPVPLPDRPSLDRAILRHKRTVGALVGDAVAASPHDPAPLALRGLLSITTARREATLSAVADLTAARRMVKASDGTDPVRAGLIAALAAGVAGERRLAARHLDCVLRRDPTQVGLLKIAQTLKFMAGDLPGMAESLDLVLPALPDDHPERGPVLGMLAFVQEESGALDLAERTGRAAVERAPDDAWGVHAVGHVFETRGLPQAGLDWFAAHREAAEDANNFRFHMAWHCALYLLSLGRIGAVLDLYDREVRPEPTDDFRDIANAVSLLWRLRLEGVDAGNRWEELAALADARAGDRELTFADLHYLMALLGAGRDGAAEALVLDLLGRAGQAGPDGTTGPEQSRALAKGGAAAAAALLAQARGDAASASRAWQRVTDLTGIGGSLAQRDVFDRSAVDAATLAGDRERALQLLNRRIDALPTDLWAQERRRCLIGRTGAAGTERMNGWANPASTAPLGGR